MIQAVVIGGGLSGTVLALYLAKRGFSVDVYERHADERSRGAGKRPALNITLCERGLAALEAIGARARVVSLAAPVRGRLIHADGAIAHQPYGTDGEEIHSVLRSDLNDALLSLAEATPGVRCHFGKRCVGVDPATGLVELEDTQTKTRSEVRGDVVFGADGAFSAVRQELQKIAGFNFSQEYWRHGGYKSLVLPARSDKSPVLEGRALHIWPRGKRMLIAFPNRNGSATLSVLLPFKGEGSFESLTNEAELLAFFRENFADVADLIPSLAEQFFSKPANSLLTIRCDPWVVGERTVLLGDAAHAILPSYGQGANAAFEDCAVLDRCIGEYAPDFGAAFREFERLRRPSMDVMAKLCVEHFDELSDLVADPEFLRRKGIERRLHELYPELYRSLYSMVTFSSVPYAEALKTELRQRALLERLAVDHGVEEKLDTPEVRGLLERSMREGVEVRP